MGYSKFSTIFKKNRSFEGRTQDQLKRSKLPCDGVTRDPVVISQPSSKGSTGISGNASNERLTRRSYSMTSKITRQPSLGKSGLPIPKARNVNANEKDTVSPVENGHAEGNEVPSLIRPRNRNSSPVMSPKDISKSESVHDRLATRSNSASRRSCSACNMDCKTNGSTSLNSIDNDSKKSIKSPTSGNMSRLTGQKSNSPSPSHEKRLINGHTDASVRPKVKKSPTVSPYLSKPSLPPKPRRKTMDNIPTVCREERSRQRPSEGNQKDNIKSETNQRTYNGDLRGSSVGRGNVKSPVSNRRHTLGGKPAISAKPLVSPSDRKLERPSSLYQRRGTESNEINGEKKRVTPERSRHRLPTSLFSKSPSKIDSNSSLSKPVSVRPKSSFSPGSNLRNSGKFTDASQDRTQSASSSHVRFRSAGRTSVDKRDPSHSPKLRRKEAKRSQSVGPADRKGKRSTIPGFVARCRQAWEDNVLKPLSKEKGAEDVKHQVVSPDNLRRMGSGRRSLVEMRKAMLFSSDTEREPRSRTGIKYRDVKSTVMNGEPKDSKSKSQAKKENIRESRITRPDFVTKKAELSEDASENRPVEVVMSSNSQIENSNSKSELQTEAINLETESQSRPVVLQENHLNQNMPVLERKVSLIDDKITSSEKENIVIASEGNNNDSKKNQLQKSSESISNSDQLDNKEKDSLIIKSNGVEPKKLEGLTVVEAQLDASTADKAEEVRDGHYFLRVVNGQQSRIEDLCQGAEKNLEKELPDEVCGIIRSAIGKASLLTNKKFKQFRGLCEKNINQSDDEPFKTMPMDLVGFWEMVMLQVEDVERMFQEVDTLKKNGWVLQQPTVITQKKAKAKVVKGTDANIKSERNSKMEQARKAREEARRKLIAEKRAAAKRNALAAAAEESAVVEIFAPEKK